MNIEWNVSNVLIAIAITLWSFITIYVFFLEIWVDKFRNLKATNTQYNFIKEWRYNSNYLDSISLKKEEKARHIINTVKIHDYFLEIHRLNKKIDPFLGIKLVDILQRHIILITINELDFNDPIIKELNKVLEDILNNYIKYDIIVNEEGGGVFSKKDLYMEALVEPIEDFIKESYYEERRRWESNEDYDSDKLFELQSIRDYKKKVALITYMKENNISKKHLSNKRVASLKGGMYND